MAANTGRTDTHRPTAPAPDTLATTLTGTLAALSVAAVIHFTVTFEHFAESWLYGAFFLALGWAQLLWAPLVVWRPSRPAYSLTVLWSGAVMNAAVIAVYFLSRTTGLAFFGDLGLPMPSDASKPEAFARCT